MKKFFASMIAMALSLCLVACGGGGPDKQPAIDAFNTANTAFTEVANTINANIDAVPEDLVDVMIDMSGVLSEYKEILESDDEVSQEHLDEMIAWFDELNAWTAECSAELDAYLVGGNEIAADNEGTSITDEQMATLTEAYNQVAPIYNQAYTDAEANGWLNDELTATELNAVAGTLGTIGTALTEDLSMLEGVDTDALVATLEELAPALNELAERVSVPYEG